ncbi:MAG: DEAD/DEAH box helicase, partial [Elusimicrobia bacterium]|nr:DEAD/DEAH box helicase [Elusimicrobiota bacterium]
MKRGLSGLEGSKTIRKRLVLPGRGRLPVASHPIIQEALGMPNNSEPAYLAREVPGVIIAHNRVLAWLLQLPNSEDLRSQGILPGDTLRFWQAAGRLAWEILAGEHFLPTIFQEAGNETRTAKAKAVWQPTLDAPAIAEKARKLEESLPPACLSFALDAKSGKAETNATALVHDFLTRVVDAELRAASSAFSAGSKRVPHDAWISALALERPEFEAPPETAEEITSAITSWKARLESVCGQGLRACLRLVEPGENGQKWMLEYLLQASADPSLLTGARNIWTGAGPARKLAALSGAHPEERLLAALSLAGRVFQPIEASLKRSDPDHVLLDSVQAYRFLKEAAPVLSNSGFGVFLPPWWKAQSAPRLSVQLRVKPKDAGEGQGTDSWLTFDWNAAMGDKTLSREELEELARMKVPLVQVRGQWVEVDHEALAKAISFWDRQKSRGLTLGEVFSRLRQSSAQAGLDVSDVQAEGWLKDLLGGTSENAGFKMISVPNGLQGTLRHYQERGFSWLSFLKTYGFGACLADDMGLGKTIQSLALILREKEEGRLKAPVLLVCPTSVAGNWMKEAERFAPGLKVILHHGTGRKKSAASFKRQVGSSDLVISTYALARFDEKLLRAQAWSGIFLDEAQNIKNPEAKQSRALRNVKAGFRVALTGTPVENRLSELWSIMEFLNPGYLGSFGDFHNRFAVPIERFQDNHATAILKRLAQPFVLRRLKTDRTIVPDLPEKMEMKVFCTLTKEQATLYRAVVKDMLEQIEKAEGMGRRGLVLAALTKLKQVANHPAHFLKDSSALPGRSGKLERLTEMVEEALSAGDSVLIFTQYTEMGELLKRHLQTKLLQEAMFLHGGLLKGARDKMVERFQSGEARIFLLTLKAGGTGLNLTRANHVFHYDRWWNPAVENQATDRAFRIGQKKNVQVH